jgi:hypothetical protein
VARAEQIQPLTDGQKKVWEDINKICESGYHERDGVRAQERRALPEPMPSMYGSQLCDVC